MGGTFIVANSPCYLNLNISEASKITKLATDLKSEEVTVSNDLVILIIKYHFTLTIECELSQQASQYDFTTSTLSDK